MGFYFYTMRILLLLVVLIIVSCKSETSPPELGANKEEGSNHDTVPLEVHDFEGLKPYLNTNTDKIYVVNFWATWCAPCIKELPYFDAISAAYSDKDVEVLLVSLDFPKKYDSHLKPFIKNNKIKSKVVALNDSDSNGWIPQINPDWSGSIPATLIFNKDKRKFYEQPFTYDELETELKEFLK